MTIEAPAPHAGAAAGERPLILLTPDLAVTERGATEREYVLRANYADAISEAGGLPLVVPLDLRHLPEALDRAAGIVVTGSGAGAQVPARRIAFEHEVVEQALERGMPLLGICHGMQLLGEHLGGRIQRDVPELIGDDTLHLPAEVPDRVAHDVTLATGSLLAGWSQTATVRVNSLHRHILVGAGNFHVTARSLDGFIEAIEGTGDSFCLGVQWHPEYRLTALDRQLLAAFVDACRAHAAHAAGSAPTRRSVVAVAKGG
ncbi:gamma-glutamyl-gamma-aminobutyrate hydrolase family protein [Ancylobacter sp. G4_0304]|uniref:gamma-glutamyl-gamma-aminobutyrate hydrolase family protein n=1 Tax=Ancylobacter sp. G4_0304 TaxID=3114289 RepID=UPI0039C61BF9